MWEFWNNRWSGSSVEGGATRGTTALVYSRIHTCFYRGYVQVYWLWIPYPRVQQGHSEAGRTSLHWAPLWHRPAGGEVRGPTSMAVTADSAGTTAVELVMVPLVQGTQKTSPWSENGSWTAAWRHLSRRRCRNQRVWKQDPFCGDRIAWALAWRSAAPQRHGLPGVVSMQALRWLTETISSCDPTLMVKEQGSLCKMA
jgi:hypothetical protein